MLLTRTLRRIAFAAGLLASFSPMAASATTILGVTVSGVGAQSGLMYIYSPQLPSSCNGIAYLSFSSDLAEYAMSLALSAKASGVQLARLDYTSGTPCTIDLVQL